MHREFKLIGAINNQVEQFDLPIKSRLDIDFLLKELEIRFNQTDCNVLECKKIIEIFEYYGKYEDAERLRSDLKIGN